MEVLLFMGAKIVVVLVGVGALAAGVTLLDHWLKAAFGSPPRTRIPGDW